MKKILILAACAVLLWGCATTKFSKEPGDSVNTLLIGRVNLSVMGVSPRYESKEFYTEAIEVHLESLPIGGEIALYSRGSDGFFFLANPFAGQYRLKKLVLHYFSQNYAWDFTLEFTEGYVFSIQKNVVNNLGMIEWWQDHKAGLQSLNISKHEDVQRRFEEKFPESGWNHIDWAEVLVEKED
jgi:hypothetical protein